MPNTRLHLEQFRWIESQTSEADRRALLSIRETVCRGTGTYQYLEVGSHLGGSLQPHVVDSRCLKIFSIDPRPLEQPDDRRAAKYRYDGNSTQRMLALLSDIPSADLSKICAFESSSWEISASSIPPLVDFAFIDGEHTNAAVLRDFDSVYRFLSPSSILAFHDCTIIPDAILRIRDELRRKHLQHSCYYFPNSSVIAIAFASDHFAETLVGFGWRQQLPPLHWHAIKLRLAKRLPRAWSAARAMKQIAKRRIAHARSIFSRMRKGSAVQR